MKRTEKKQRQLNKSYKKHKSPWKVLTVLAMVGTLGFGMATIVAGAVDNALSVFVSGKLANLENEDVNAVYYQADFEGEEMLAYGKMISEQVEAEGAILLQNKNEALPLKENAKVSLFSTSSVNLVCGGTGSGAIDTSGTDNLKEALVKTGVEVNETLWDFYENGAASEYSRGKTGYLPKEYIVHEAPWNVYTRDVLDSVKQYGDAGIVVLSRTGGEEYDLTHAPANYLALDENEKELLKNVCEMKQQGKLSSVIVLINSSNPMEMQFLKDYDVDSCMQIGTLGGHGVNAVADMLVGKISPSGSLADTWCYEYYSAPAMWNFEATNYESAEEMGVPANADSYMIYQEGIYVGYRYYETRYEDFVMATGNAGEYDYHSVVAFPFGHGLSYTTFDYGEMNVVDDESEDCYKVSVTVTNTGKVSGKETVQVYGQSPYTEYDKEYGVEKSAVMLCGYAKTEVLNPGESQKLTITVDKKDFASFDTYGEGTYIMEAGDYFLTVAEDAHQAVNQILSEKGYSVGTVKTDLIWKWEETNFDNTTYAVSENGTPITNRLSDADPNLYKGIEEQVQWLSRRDWMGTFPNEIVKLTLTEMLAEDLQHVQYDPAEYDMEAYKMPAMEENHGLRLYDMIGKSMDDSDWELLLNQLSYDDMVALTADAFHSRSAVESVQAPFARDENGASGLNTNFIAEEIDSTSFPSESMMASTFNNELIYEVGRVLGNNCLNAGISCLYGPAANMHRTAYGGRNFEYYSEDAYLSGQICAAEAKGVEDMGVDTILKHFALNDCEADRIGLGVWLNEQAAREIYLKAFQPAIESAGTNGVMAAYTRWGATWSGGFESLITGILREEWGCDGWVISDNVRTDMITGAAGLLAGLTVFDAPIPAILNMKQYENDPLIVNKMREACHINLYALANSSAMNRIGENTIVKEKDYFMITLFKGMTIFFAALSAVFAYQWYLGRRRWKTEVMCMENKGEKICEIRKTLSSMDRTKNVKLQPN